ncbi:MAG: bi-domain-containing oxidoreductase [Candidatus Krumholzibacteriota bacterium]|nr:bi-domain-containing oxidoreductase [Candidatus Krumholzibacteriota bacterium]
MLQLIQSYRTGEMKLGEVPDPLCKDEGILIRTEASVVSAGTDKIMIDLAKKSLLGKSKARPDLVKQVIGKMKQEGIIQTLQKVFTKLDSPMPLGYSCAGRVIEVGGKVTEFAVGDRVACAGSGYANHAEVNYVPRNLAVKIPVGVSFEDAAFVTLGTIALQGVRQAETRPGERVGVLGLGLIGLLTVQLLKASGCKVIGTDIDADKLKIAEELGADKAVLTERYVSACRSFTDDYGLDSIIITASTPSNEPIEMAPEVCRHKGKVVALGMIGMNVPRNKYYEKELDLRLSMAYGPGRYDPEYEEKGIDYPYPFVRWTEQRNMQAFLEFVEEGKVTPGKVVTHRFEFDNVLDSYKLLSSDSDEKYIGIVLNYDTEKETAAFVEISSFDTVKSKKITAGFIGAGNFAKGVLLPQVKKSGGIQLKALVTATGASSRGSAEKYGFTNLYSDYKEMLKDDSINTVFITTRHNLHYRMITDSLLAGKHVYCEKPLVLNNKELNSLTELYDGLENKPVLMIGFNRRFSEHLARIKDFADSTGERPVINYRINAGFIPKDTWVQDLEIGGGRIIGEVCHFIDAAAFIAGSKVEEVFASELVTPGNYKRDNVSIILKFTNGSLATISYLANGSKSVPKERIEVFCGGGAAVCDNFKKTEIINAGKKSRVKSRFSKEKGFRSEIEAFRKAIVSSGTNPIPFSSIVNTTRATFAVMESIEKAKVVQVE